MQRSSDRNVWPVLLTLKGSSVTREGLIRVKANETNDRGPDGNRVLSTLATVWGRGGRDQEKERNQL